MVVDLFATYLKPLVDRGEHPRVLDIGSGKGRHMQFLAENGCDVIGLEPSAEFRTESLQRLADANVQGALFVGGRGQELPFPGESMDAALAMAVFHYDTWADAEKYMAEAARVLKQGGVLALVVRSINDNEEERRDIKEQADQRRDNYKGRTAVDLYDDNGNAVKPGDKEIIRHYFTEEEIRQLAGDNEFELLGDIAERPRNVREERGQPDKIDPATGNPRVMQTYRVILRKKSSAEG